MVDKMDLEGERNSVPFWQSPEKKVSARLNTCLVFPKPRLVPVMQGPAALLRKPAGSCYGIGAGSY